jgi:hypothetical protein
MDDQIEIKRQFRQQQEKYAYYIIALCVAAIAFSITITRDASLKFSQIPLGLAVLTWGLSIYFGLKFIQTIISALHSNNSYLDVIKGTHPIVGNHPQKIEYASNILKETMEEKGKTAGKFYDRQNTFFFMGFISFIVWHILEMYLNT